MKGLQLVFNNDGTVSLPGAVISGVACIKQNCVVNIATSKGSDKTFPDKGTNLFEAGVQGAIYDIQSAQHAANFAALDTLTFIRENEYTDQLAATVDQIQLELIAISIGRLSFLAQFTFTDGTKSPANATI